MRASIARVTRHRGLGLASVVLLASSALACAESNSGTTPLDTSGSTHTTTHGTSETSHPESDSDESGHETGDETGTNSDDSQTGDDDDDSTTDSDWTGFFPPEAPWTTKIDDAATDPSSNEIITWLDGQGWGLGHAHIDFSIEVLQARADTPLRSFEPTDDFYTPDCDHVDVPVPEGGNLEGESGYACESDGDCHLIVVDRSRGTLYEMWRANIENDTFFGGCLATWQLGHLYGPEGRGQQCTSADAAGYPIAPLLVTADEVAAGEIPHALRFILPNSSIRADEYVSPATHGTSATSGPPSAPPYGVRLRLRSDYPLDSLPNDAARTVARALQTYGMFLADGGNVLWTFQSDRHTTAKWDGLLGPRDLEDVRPADFQVIAMEPAIPLTNDCVRAYRK